MRLPLRRSSLQLKITVLCIVIAVTAVLLVGISQYIVVPGILRNKTSEIRRGRLETVARGLDQRLDSVLAFADTFVSNAEINNAIRRPDQTYTYGDATLLSTVFRIAVVSNSDLIDSIVVATDRGKRFIGGNGGYLSHQIIGDRFAAMEEELKERSWAIRYETAPVRNFSQMVGVQQVVSIYYILRDTVSLDRIGVMYLSLNPSALLSVPEEEENSTVLLVDGDGGIIAGTVSGKMPEELSVQLALHSGETSGNFLFGKGEQSRFAVFTETTVPGWRLVEYIPYQSLIRESRKFFLLLSYVLAIAFAAIIFLTVYGTWKSLAPLRRLRNSMLAVQEGNYDVTVEVETNDEIGELAHTYNLMLGR